MQHHRFPLKDTGSFPSLFLDYIDRHENLDSFYSDYPDLKGFARQITNRSMPTTHRETLSKVLHEQYRNLETSDLVIENIRDLIDTNTFTVTTGHQLNIFTGPLYVIYKIISTINLARKLKENYPEKNFVPIYWMGSEDHDFEEISTAHVGSIDLKWKTDQTGPTGRFDPTELAELAREIPGNPEFFKKAYANNSTLADAVREYMDHLFGEYGLVVIEPDHPELKKLLLPVIKDDLLNHTAERIVNESSAKLNELGYETQVHPRQINYFYIEDGLRERIIKKNEQYKVLNTTKVFSREELLNELEQFPGKFSPNVIMRPLYQEVILPNIAYLGGPSEVSYWFQYKELFTHYETPFPIIMPRNFSGFLPHTVYRKFEKTGFTLEDLFLPQDKLEKKLVIELTGGEILLTQEKQEIASLMNKVQSAATDVDPTLTDMVKAETAGIFKRMERIEKKMIRSEKRTKEDKLSQIREVHDCLYPRNSLQERFSNLCTFYFDYPNLISYWVKTFDPLDFSFNLVISDE